MKKEHILVVDDEALILKLIRINLEDAGFDATVFLSAREALNTIENKMPDLIILDINMPQMDGFETCALIREMSEVPIIMLSARQNPMDKVKLFEMGADDYITKPFTQIELIARIKAVLRRTRVARNDVSRPNLRYEDIEINFSARQVLLSGNEVRLTPTEYNLLQELSLNAGKVLTHNQLLNKVWGPEYQDEHEYLHEFIHRLRNKLEELNKEYKYIISVPGIGYRFKSKGDPE